MPPPIAMGPGLPTHVKQKGITVQDFVFFTKEERDRYSAKLKKLADRTEQINEDRPRHPPHFNTDEALQEAYKLRMIINSNKTAESDSYVFHEHRVFPSYLDDVPSITELDESMSQDIKDIDELEKRYQKLRKDILLKKRSVNKRLKEKGAIAKKDDSRQKQAIVKREEDGTVMHLVVCLSRGSITINGLGRMCSVCVHETTLPADRFPRYLNELICNPEDCCCMLGQGICVQKIIYLTFQRKVGDRWYYYDQAIRVGCECELVTTGVFMPFI